METMIQEIANVGFTILCIAIAFIVVNWLDKNVFNKRGK